MTFWQSCVITLLAESTDILGSGGEAVADSDQEKYAKQAQNFLICLEMLGFSIAHFYCFPVEEWEDGYRPEEDQSKFGDKMALGDFLHDLKLIMRRKSKKKRTKDQMGSRSSSVGSFSTVPEEDEEVGALLEDVEGLLLEEESVGGKAARVLQLCTNQMAMLLAPIKRKKRLQNHHSETLTPQFEFIRKS